MDRKTDALYEKTQLVTDASEIQARIDSAVFVGDTCLAGYSGPSRVSLAGRLCTWESKGILGVVRNHNADGTWVKHNC